MRGTFAVIDTRAMEDNVRAIRGVLRPGVQLLTAVKAGGYGHGAVPAARAALAGGATALGVASLEEALELRRAGIDAQVLVFGRVPAVGLPVAAAAGVDVTLTSDWATEGVPPCSPALRVHIKVDTGMARLGFRDTAGALRAAEFVQSRSDMELVGLFSHLACADDLASDHAPRQAERFAAIVNAFEAAGLRPPQVHLANSAGTFRSASWHHDLVRVGISAYGLPPSADFPVPCTLTQAMHVYAVVQRVAWLDEGETVGYGATFRTARRTRVATLPIGYADGYHRVLSNRGQVLLRGRRVPVIGRVCMDQMMVDVTDVPEAAAGDVATVYGMAAPDVWNGGALQARTGADVAQWICDTFRAHQATQPSVLSLTEVARAADTISYELMCALAPRVVRLYV